MQAWHSPTTQHMRIHTPHTHSHSHTSLSPLKLKHIAVSNLQPTLSSLSTLNLTSLLQFPSYSRLSIKSQLSRFKKTRNRTVTHTRLDTCTHIKEETQESSCGATKCNKPILPAVTTADANQTTTTAYRSIAPCLHNTKFLQALSEPSKRQLEPEFPFWILKLPVP